MEAPTRVAAEAPDILALPALARLPGLRHGFSTSRLGSMHRSGGHHTTNRATFALKLDLDPDRLAFAGAVHGAEVALAQGPGLYAGYDALVTATPGLPLMITAADCVPIILHDPVNGALGLVHAGWRGTAQRVAAAGLQAMVAWLGAAPAGMIAGIGPSICGHCYEIGPEVAATFSDRYLRPSREGRSRLDLAAANRDQLIEAGLPEHRIHQIGICTMESDFLYSHRRDGDGRRFACIAALAAAETAPVR